MRDNNNNRYLTTATTPRAAEETDKIMDSGLETSSVGKLGGMTSLSDY